MSVAMARTSPSVRLAVTAERPSNQQPTGSNDSATTTQGVAVAINVLANDSDPDGDRLTVTISGQPRHGTATVNNGQILYTPNAGFVGEDSFTYTLADGRGGVANATVTVTVTDVVGSSSSTTVYLPVVTR